MKKYFLLFATLLSLPSVIQGQTPAWLYAADLNMRIGFHAFDEPAGFLDSKRETLNDDIFFRQSKSFYSNTINLDTVNSSRSMNILLTFESTFGIYLDKLPYLKRIDSLKEFKGFRAGIGNHFYPFSGRKSYEFSGQLEYQTPGAFDSKLMSKTYRANIRIEEDLFMLVPFISFYYYHERGLAFLRKISFLKRHDVIPFAGIEVGVGFLNGKRKTLVSSNPTTIQLSDNSVRNYEIEAAIQESFFNQPGLRFAVSGGFQFYLFGPHFIEVRAGIIQQSFSTTLKRKGGFTEFFTQTDGTFEATWTEGVRTENVDFDFDSSGFYLTFGYTVALL